MAIGSYEICKGKLRDLLSRMDSCPAEVGMPMLDAFVKDHEASLYNEIGRLTRQLHDSLTTFQTEEKIFSLTKEEIPSAKERLKYVMAMTEQAAQNVLGIVEMSIPVALEIKEDAGDLSEQCKKIAAAEAPGDGMPRLLGDVGEFLSNTKDKAGVLHGQLVEILMAQEYQDLTSQVIKKVINLVQDVEDSLVKLIKITGQKMPVGEFAGNDNKPAGPYVPGVDDQQTRAANQDDVDQLLASLGF